MNAIVEIHFDVLSSFLIHLDLIIMSHRLIYLNSLQTHKAVEISFVASAITHIIDWVTVPRLSKLSIDVESPQRIFLQ